MRKLSALALLALPLSVAAAGPAPERMAPGVGPDTVPAPRARDCPPARITYALAGPASPRVQKLGEQPPANHYLAVDRQVGGCPEPAVVRTGISR